MLDYYAGRLLDAMIDLCLSEFTQSYVVPGEMQDLDRRWSGSCWKEP